MSNLFWPIYKKLEGEFIELSYFIYIDKKQLKTYSIKIADLILRTVSECENIAKELCKKENIKFRDKKGKIRDYVNFHEYINGLDQIYLLNKKLVSFDFENVSEGTFDTKHKPFQKEIRKINGQEKEIWKWYYSYNSIKHDRVKHFKEANLGNLIEGLAALFLLNIYYVDKTFFIEKEYDYDSIISNIEGFSNVFTVEYACIMNKEDKRIKQDSFFDPISYFEIALPYSTYIIETDKKYKTESDQGADMIEKIESKALIYQDGTLKNKYDKYEFKDHITVCSIVASLNKVKDFL